MLVIDRFEGNKAVIEFSTDDEKSIFNIPKSVLPADANEGDIIEINVNKDATEKRKEKMRELSDELFE